MSLLPDAFTTAGGDYSTHRLLDIPREIILGGRCARCQRVGPVDRLRIARRWSAEKRLAELDARLICIDCRNREGNRFTLYGRLGPVGTREPMARNEAKWQIDLYSDGACVYRLDSAGEIAEVAAWASNSLIARAAGDALALQYPSDAFSVRRRSWTMHNIEPTKKPPADRS